MTEGNDKSDLDKLPQLLERTKAKQKEKVNIPNIFFSNNVYFNNKILQYNTNYIFQIATFPVTASQTAFRNRIKRYSLIMTTIANVPKTVNTNYSFS